MDDFLDSLMVILVLYQTPLEDSESFCSILEFENGSQDLDVYVYDNSPGSQHINTYKGLCITYVHDAKNPGVSQAYNSGAEYARAHKKKWILLLDQDTSLPMGLLDTYRKASLSNSDIKLFVPILKLKNGKIFSPFRYRFKRGFYLDEIEAGVHSLKNLSPVNSGILISLDSFFEVGGYNQMVKLDFSDFQFIERFRRKYNLFYVIDSIGKQDFSDDEVSLTSQANRFVYFCEGARNIEKNGIWDWAQYNVVVFLRGLRLVIRYRDCRFMTTYFKDFLIPQKERS